MEYNLATAKASLSAFQYNKSIYCFLFKLICFELMIFVFVFVFYSQKSFGPYDSTLKVQIISVQR